MSLQAMQSALASALHNNLPRVQAYEAIALQEGADLLRSLVGKIEPFGSLRAQLDAFARDGVTLTERVQRRASELALVHSEDEISHVSSEVKRHVASTRLRPIDTLSLRATWEGLSDRLTVTVQPALDRPEALQKEQPQVDRIVTTELWRAYNDTRADVASHLALLGGGQSYATRRVSPEDFFPVVVKRWDATLDKRTCAQCKSAEGQIALLGMPFTSSIPLHPRCRCAAGWWVVPAPYP